MGRKRRILKDGTKFGKLTVIGESYRKKHKHSTWLCLCECAKKVIVRTTHLLEGRVLSCGCAWHPLKSIESDKTALKDLYRSYKSTAKKKGHLFELDLDVFKELTQSVCFYCNKSPNSVRKPHPRNNNTVYRPTQLTPYIYNGIDRKNNSMGYSRDNCVPCCKECNFLKSNRNLDEFIALIRTIELHTRNL